MLKVALYNISLWFVLLGTSSVFAQKATVLRSSGLVLVNGKALTGKIIATGATIDTTAPNASVDLSIAGKSYHRFRGGLAVLTISKDEQSVSLEDKAGEIFSFLDPKGHQQLKVKTRSMAMGVRGTKFYVQESKEKSYLCVCEGTVDVTAANIKIPVTAGFDLYVHPDDKSAAASKASDPMMTLSKSTFADMGFPVK